MITISLIFKKYKNGIDDISLFSFFYILKICKKELNVEEKKKYDDRLDIKVMFD